MHDSYIVAYNLTRYGAVDEKNINTVIKIELVELLAIWILKVVFLVNKQWLKCYRISTVIIENRSSKVTISGLQKNRGTTKGIKLAGPIKRVW